MLLENFNLDPKYLTATLVAIVLAVFLLERHGRSLPVKKGKYHQVAGTVFHQLFNFHRLHDYMADLAGKHKTYRLLSLGRNEVYTVDPINVEYILKTNFANYGKDYFEFFNRDEPQRNDKGAYDLEITVQFLKIPLAGQDCGEFQHTILKDLLGDGIFAVDGEKWKQQRKVASHQFSTGPLRDFSSSVFKSNAVKLAGVVYEASISNQIIEIQDLFFKSTLDSVFKIVLGVELDTMGGTYEGGTRFSSAFDDASAITLHRYVDIFWKIKRFMHIGSEALLGKNIREVDEFVYKVIRSRIEQVQKSSYEPVRKDLLLRFLEMKKTDPKYLRDIILNFIIAGKDTTAITLSWFLYTLCKHPHVQEKIVHEIKEATKLEKFSTIEEVADSITEEALEKMQYLTAALTETLRIYPAVPWDGKICFSDDTWPDGFSVKKGDFVSYLPYAMGRMKSIWGDDAEEFKPERWLDSNGKFQQESPFKFTAFQAGPRVCLGKDFSYRQMKIFSAVLLGSHKFELADQNKPVHYRTTLTLHIDKGLHLYCYRRLGQSDATK